MPDLLLELFSEEIPARMQRRAADDLKKLVTDALVNRGLDYEGARALVTPRRLALHIAGLPVKGRDVREERKGPKVGAPEAAVQGFLKSAGLSSLDQAKIQSDAKKGDFYIAVTEKPGEKTADVIADILPGIIRNFPWPKSMRWGKASAQPGSLRWVRPLHSIICSFGPETEEPEIIAFDVDGIRAGNVTRGHRFMAPGEIKVRRLEDYVASLDKAKVIADIDRRKDIILADAKNLAFAQNLELVEDEGLLEEVAGLVEWPVVLMGSFDAAFLDVPDEVIRATIRANQKCFVLRDPATGRLANKFLLVSNIIASDGGAAIVAGNERVIRARLSDALYFWKTDQKDLPDYVTPENKGKWLDQRLAKLRALNIVFHEKLGTQGERVDRIIALARELAPLVGADPVKAARAAELAKADLMTEVVGEFPETQGLMGRRYALLQGEDASVAAAIEEHYKPQGPSDRVPTDPVSVAVALADKLDTLVGFWAIDEKPTGSKDPFALRRAALGVIRLVVENGIEISLSAHFRNAWLRHHLIHLSRTCASKQEALARFENEKREVLKLDKILPELADLLSFFHDRLKVMLREQGARHDLVDAVLASGSSSPSPRASGGEGQGVGGLTAAHSSTDTPHPQSLPAASGGREGGPAEANFAAAQPLSPPSPTLPHKGGEGSMEASGAVAASDANKARNAAANDNLLLIVRRVEALGKFLDTEDGKNLLAGWKRAANILRAEEKKDGVEYVTSPNRQLFQTAEEESLYSALVVALPEAEMAMRDERYAEALTILSRLRKPVDAFFEHVQVNADDKNIRANRLRLLNQLRGATAAVADFSKIAG